MKKLLLTLSTLCVIVFFSSLKLQEELNCYDKYSKKFEERGANEVENGWHEDVIVTFRKGGNADCYPAKVKVEELKVTQIYLKYADGTFEIYKKNFKPGGEFSIINGISQTKITVEDELVNVIFVKHIKPPKKKLVAAPDPDDL
jgi:hypothetical protein